MKSAGQSEKLKNMSKKAKKDRRVPCDERNGLFASVRTERGIGAGTQRRHAAEMIGSGNVGTWTEVWVRSEVIGASRKRTGPWRRIDVNSRDGSRLRYWAHVANRIRRRGQIGRRSVFRTVHDRSWRRRGGNARFTRRCAVDVAGFKVDRGRGVIEGWGRDMDGARFRRRLAIGDPDRKRTVGEEKVGRDNLIGVAGVHKKRAQRDEEESQNVVLFHGRVLPEVESGVEIRRFDMPFSLWNASKKRRPEVLQDGAQF